MNFLNYSNFVQEVVKINKNKKKIFLHRNRNRFLLSRILASFHTKMTFTKTQIKVSENSNYFFSFIISDKLISFSIVVRHNEKGEQKKNVISHGQWYVLCRRRQVTKWYYKWYLNVRTIRNIRYFDVEKKQQQQHTRCSLAYNQPLTDSTQWNRSLTERHCTIIPHSHTHEYECHQMTTR